MDPCPCFRHCYPPAFAYPNATGGSAALLPDPHALRCPTLTVPLASLSCCELRHVRQTVAHPAFHFSTETQSPSTFLIPHAFHTQAGAGAQLP
jgi:hypothetical protein